MDTVIQPASMPAIKSSVSLISLLCIVLVHALLIAFMVSRTPHVQSPELTSPSVQGILIAPAVQAPSPPRQSPPPPVSRPAPSQVTPTVKPSVKQPPPARKPPPTPTIQRMSAPAVTPPAPISPAPSTAADAPLSSASIAEPAPQAPAATEAVVLPRSDASHLKNPAPVYPMMSRRLKEQGTVLIELTVLASGRSTDLVIKQSSGFRRLDEAAMNAVREWQFEPARRGDTPIAWRYVQPITFALN